MVTKDEMSAKDEKAAKDELTAKDEMTAKDKKVSKALDKMDKVQMEKDGEIVVLAVNAVESKKGEGFVVVGTVDADGKVTATVVGTPAHVFLTSDGFLKAIPDNYNLVVPIV